MARITGTSGADQLYMTSDRDDVYAQGGDDTIYFLGTPGNTGRDYVDGGLGRDTLSFIYYDEPVYAYLFVPTTFPAVGLNQRAYGPAGGNGLTFSSIENLTGSRFGDFLGGARGNDVLDGRGGNDVLQGSGGADTLIGGSGRDTFRYWEWSDSTLSAPDVINDFVRGSDKIDFSSIDPAASASINSFVWDGRVTSNNLPIGHLGFRVTSSGVSLIGNCNVNSDTLADMRIDIKGLTTISSSDIIF